MAFTFTDYADPRSRVYKVQIAGEVTGDIKTYTFSDMNRWIKKWEDPGSAIRHAARYRQIYLKNLKYLYSIREKRLMQIKYIIAGLTDCAKMFEKIQQMPAEDEYKKSFSWETKCIFFAYFDFCEPPRNDASIRDRIIIELSREYGELIKWEVSTT